MTIRSQKIASHEHHKLEQLALKERPIRDLAWALCHPSLFASIPDFDEEWFNKDYIDEGLYPWLQKLDQSPEELYEHLQQQRSTRLGIYFEQLLSFYFEHYPRFTLLAKNYQVNDQQRTLGEFDFIIFDEEYQHVKHIEVAVKFYLGHKDYSKPIKNNTPLHNWHNWVGPNEKDTLAIKMRHLKQHQLPLSKTIWGQQALSNLFDSNKAVTSRLLISGRFYFPSEYNIEGPLFSTNDSNHSWMSSQALLSGKPFLKKGSDYCLLPRQHWLSEIKADDINDYELSIYSEKGLKDFIAEGAETKINEWQVAELDTSMSDTVEIKRLFIINKQNQPADE